MPHVAPYSFGSALAGETPRRPRVSVGIVNNMPDAALEATERQFVSLLQLASAAYDIRIHLFTLPGIGRGQEARERIKTRYIDYSALADLHMDGLIVTGAVPLSPSIPDEPYWSQFVELVDYARRRTLSTIWSCLAAHAAVLCLDGVQRHRLPRKLSGVFEIEARAGGLFGSGGGTHYRTPHSRYNDVRESDLMTAGYRILGGSPEVGVDAFEKDTPSRFVFLQGHPEYAPDTLLREYRRDVGHYLARERDDLPDIPSGYLSRAMTERLEGLAVRATLERRVELLADYPDPASDRLELRAWSTHASFLVDSWVSWMVGEKARRPKSAEAAA